MKYIILSVAVVILCVAVYFIGTKYPLVIMNPETSAVVEIEITPTTTTGQMEPTVIMNTRGPISTIGTSVKQHPITAYHFGVGSKELLFIGGIHGGYSFNTTLLAYELIDHLTANPALVPEGVTITVIPTLNPDGQVLTTGTSSRFTAAMVKTDEASRVAGRFNGNKVDLNRNFNCDWMPESMWQNRKVSGGSAAFSEPESAALRDYVKVYTPVAVVAWYSAEGAVYTSACSGKTPTMTTDLVEGYAQAAGYAAKKDFNAYKINGDMMNWLASENIPAVSVLLTNHSQTEWIKNLAGIEAIINAYTE